MSSKSQQKSTGRKVIWNYIYMYFSVYSIIQLIEDSVFHFTVPSRSPKITSAFNTSSTSIELSWKAIPLEYQNGPIHGYTVRYRQLCNNESAVVICRKHSLEADHLQKYAAYEISLAAFNEKGVGPWVTLVVFTDQDGMLDDHEWHLLTYIFFNSISLLQHLTLF